MRRSHFFAVFFRFVLRRPLATRSRLNTTSLLGPGGLQLTFLVEQEFVCMFGITADVFTSRFYLFLLISQSIDVVV
jgi:hypothetical protein